ncbi:MAG: hypothetical protein ABFR33_04865 [Verrucomicrobiota bacterium]
MKTVRSIILMAIAAMLLSSCISRTTTTNAPLGQGEDGKVTEKKLIWIWQKEFRNP